MFVSCLSVSRRRIVFFAFCVVLALLLVFVLALVWVLALTLAFVCDTFDKPTPLNYHVEVSHPFCCALAPFVGRFYFICFVSILYIHCLRRACVRLCVAILSLCVLLPRSPTLRRPHDVCLEVFIPTLADAMDETNVSKQIQDSHVALCRASVCLDSASVLHACVLPLRSSIFHHCPSA